MDTPPQRQRRQNPSILAIYIPSRAKTAPIRRVVLKQRANHRPYRSSPIFGVASILEQSIGLCLTNSDLEGDAVPTHIPLVGVAVYCVLLLLLLRYPMTMKTLMVARSSSSVVYSSEKADQGSPNC